MLRWNHAAFTCFHCIHYTFGVELLGYCPRCRWGHGWYVDEGMDDVCWFVSMYYMYVRTLVMLVLILMVESSHLPYQPVNGSQRMDFWGEILKEPKWPEKWFDTYLGDGGNIYAGTAKNLTLKRQFTRHSNRIIALWGHTPRQTSDVRMRATMKAFTMRSLCCNMAKSRKGSGGGDRMDMEIADILRLTAFVGWGWCLNFSSNMNIPETEAPFCDPHWCRCHQFHPQFLCCAVCRGHWYSTEWRHA